MANWQDELKQYKTAPDKNYDIHAFQQPQTMSATAAPQAGNMQIPMATGTAQTMTAPQQQAQNGVRTNYNNLGTGKYTNGSTVDLSKLYEAVSGSKVNQQWTLKDLQDKMSAQVTNGQTVDLSGLQTALGAKPGDTFTPEQLKTAIGGANTATDPVAVQAAKYQDPAQFQALITQMNQVLAPLTQAQQGAAQSAYGQASSKLADRWASNGLLASGGAAAQQQQGANALAQQMQGIEAQQQANAIPLAQQFAQLSLTEDQQKFGQNANNRDFLQGRAQNNVGNMLGALGQQYGQQNAWQNQAQNLAGMNMAQNQWSQQFGQQNKQQDVANMQNALGMQQGMSQDYLRNLSNTTGLDVNQNQWSQEYGLRRNEQEFAQKMAKKSAESGDQKFNANLGQQQNQMAQNLYQFDQGMGMDYMKLAQQGTQFDRNLAQQGTQFDQKMGLDNKQANGNMALQLSQLFGKGVNPTSEWGNMFDQVQGSNTAQSQNSVMDFLGKMLQNQPFMPNNAGDAIGSQNSNYSSMTDFLNKMGGQASQRTYDNAQQLDFEKTKQAQDMGYKWANYATDKTYKEHLMSKGISEMDAKDSTNAMIADLMGAPNEAAANQWLSDPKTIQQAKSSGANMEAVQDVLNKKYGKPPTSSATGGDNQRLLNDAYDNAAKAFQNDPDYRTATPAEKQKLLDDYANNYMNKYQKR